MLKLKWTTRRGTAGIQLHADPATAATTAGWVGFSSWCGRMGLSVDLLSRQTRVDDLGAAGQPHRMVRLGPVRVRFGRKNMGPNIVTRVLADLLTTRGPEDDVFAELHRELPWLRIDLDPRARIVWPWWWPRAVAEAVKIAAEGTLQRQVELKRSGG